MTASTGVLDFFIVEASEYLERLDNLLTSAGPAGPNADSFGRYARALRGSATMSRQYGIADVAGALERIARALRNRAMGWTPAASAAVIAAVDDLRILVRAVRVWGPADDRRALARTAELDR
ncbi:MAG TPA: Hpt domain-containing protein, partial [Gemmatimonadaceae bacterium]|nr:Hpt domain-containing protein [Gemmatimonadaceae bacterium]